MKLFIVRHGETRWNRESRMQGHGNSALTRDGALQAFRYGEKLRELIGDTAQVVLYTSPLFRAQQTASVVADTLGLAAEQWNESDLLMEMCLGEWEGLTYDEIDARYPGVREQRDAAKWSWSDFGVESIAATHQRARRWLDALEPAPVVVAVTHGGLSRALRGAVLGLSPDAILDLERHAHGRFFAIDEGDSKTHHVAPS